jgi:large subunit ribosomal protein L4
VDLGPKPRDYSYALPKKVRRAALRSALSLKVQEGLLKVVTGIDISEPKTKQLVGFLRDLRVENLALILLAEDNPHVQLAGRNLPNVKVLRVEGVNIYDLLSYDSVICAKDALAKLQERVAS